MHRWLRMLVLTVAVLHLPAFTALSSVARFTTEGNPFGNTWARVDFPIEDDQVDRAWIWGPRERSFRLMEPYSEASGGERLVLYLDKGRMELTGQVTDPDSIWTVTNGLLVEELISGRLQLGDSTFEQRSPALINVAGDSDQTDGVTYATLGQLRAAPPLSAGAAITWRLDHNGSIVHEQRLEVYGVTAAHHVILPGIDHQIASPFWDFINSTGLVYDSDQYVTDTLFESPVYATGYPITEAYWITAKVAGEYRDVLLQCFERRCLTYAPDNAPGWQVESGNVGQHYFSWRYGENLGDQGASLAFQPLIQGSAPGGENAEPFLVVAATDAQLSDLTRLLSSADTSALAGVDLSADIVIAAFLGLRPTSGYQIEIVAVAVHVDILEVTVRMTSPPPDQPVRQGFETPYHVVAVDRDPLVAVSVSQYRLVEETGAVLAVGPLAPLP